MKAIILVGGEGTRLRPLTCNVPKPMVPIVNRPFLERMIAYLKKNGISDIVLSLCYLPDRIQSYFGDGSAFGVRLTYIVEPMPLGTAGAIKYASDHVALDEAVFVFNGDVLTDLDLQGMLEAHRQKGAAVSLALTPVEDPTAYGLVERDADGRVRRFIEKPGWESITSNLINAGTYLVEPGVLKYVPPKIHFMFENGLFPVLLQVGEPVFGHVSNAYWIDIGTPARYITVHHDVLMGQVAQDFPGKRVFDGVWVDEEARLDRTAKILGPVVIGRGCEIGRNVRLVGPLAMGEGCVVGSESVIEQAVIWRNTRIGRQVTVKQSVIAEACLIDDNVWVANGTIIGDRVAIGGGNRLEHGIRIWPERTIEPNTITF